MARQTSPIRWREGVRSFARTPPGIIGIVIAGASLSFAVVNKITDRPASHAPAISTSVNFIYTGLTLTPRTSALVVAFTNEGAVPAQVVDLVIPDSDVYIPAPLVVFDRRRHRFVHSSRPVPSRLDPGQRVTYLVAVRPLNELRPLALVATLATGERVRADIRPFIEVLECTGYRSRNWGCLVIGRTAALAAQPDPWLITQGGIAALAPRRVQKGHTAEAWPAALDDRLRAWDDGPCAFYENFCRAVRPAQR